MRNPGGKTKGYTARQIRKVLGPEPCHILDQELGCQPVAVDTTIRRVDPTDPTGTKIGPPERAVVCRLYPDTDRAKIAFGQARVECAECIYFPQPDDDPMDDDIEIVLLRAFHDAALQARALLEQFDAGQTNQRPSSIIVPRSL